MTRDDPTLTSSRLAVARGQRQGCRSVTSHNTGQAEHGVDMLVSVVAFTLVGLIIGACVRACKLLIRLIRFSSSRFKFCLR